MHFGIVQSRQQTKGLASKSGNHRRTLENSDNAGPDGDTSYRKKEEEGLNLTEVKKSFLRLLKWRR